MARGSARCSAHVALTRCCWLRCLPSRASSRCRRCVALCRRRASREASEVATALVEFAARGAAATRRSPRPLDATLSGARAAPARSRNSHRLRLRAGTAAAATRSCWRTPRSGWRCGSSAASPSNARCWRAPRPGRRRGALAAIVAAAGAAGAARAWAGRCRSRCWRSCCCLEAFGCWLLWRVARVEI